MYPIKNVVKIFNKNKLFLFIYKIEKICKYCNIEKLNNDEILFMVPLIKKNTDEINKIDLYKIIQDKLINRYTRCPWCGYNIDELNSSPQIDNSLYAKYKEIEYPQFLFFIFELEDINNAFNDFVNLSNSQKKIVNLAKESIFLNSSTYNIIGTVNYPIAHNYTNSIINITYNDDPNLINKNFYYKHLLYNTLFTELLIKDFNEHIIQLIYLKNIYILLYSKY